MIHGNKTLTYRVKIKLKYKTDKLKTRPTAKPPLQNQQTPMRNK